MNLYNGVYYEISAQSYICPSNIAAGFFLESMKVRTYRLLSLSTGIGSKITGDNMLMARSLVAVG